MGPVQGAGAEVDGGGEVGTTRRGRKTSRKRRAPRTVDEAIRAANAILPGKPAPFGRDPRWAALVDVGEFIVGEPEKVWAFVVRWSRYPCRDLSAGLGCVLVEHLLEHHFDRIFPRALDLARASARFADTLSICSTGISPPNLRRLKLELSVLEGEREAREPYHESPRLRAVRRMLDRRPRTVHEAVRRAESVLPGRPVPLGSRAPNLRMEALDLVNRFVESRPEEVWQFAARWGTHRSPDLRYDIIHHLVSELLREHFDLVFPRVEALARKNMRFGTALGSAPIWWGLSRERVVKVEQLAAEVEQKAQAAARRGRQRARGV